MPPSRADSKVFVLQPTSKQAKDGYPGGLLSDGFVRHKKIKFHLTYTHYRDTTHCGYNSNVSTV